MQRLTDTARFALSHAALMLMLSVWGAALVIVLFSASKLYSLAMLAATLFPLVLFTAGNPRLFIFCGLIFTAPLGLSINFQRIVHIGGAPSYSIDAMDFFLLPLVVFLVRDFSMGYRHRFRIPGISAWWIGLIVLGVWSVIEGPFRQISSYEVLRMTKCWVLFLVIINECVREKHFEYAAWALAASLLLNVLVAFVQYAVGGDLGLQALGEASPEATLGANYGVFLSFGSAFRVGALMGHPNLYAAYLALLLPVIISLLFTRLGTVIRFSYAILALLGVITLVLTLSRAGWAAFAFAMLCLTVVLFAHPVLRNRFLGMKTGLVAAMASGVLLASGLIVRRLTQSDSGALDFRYEWMTVAWKMIQEKPFLGYGLNTFSYNMAEFTQYSVGKMNNLFGETWPVVHNIYLLVWSEQGTVGFILFMGFLVHLFWLAVKNSYCSYSDKVFMMNIGLACGLSALMIDGLASFFIRVPASGRIFWVAAALVVAANYWNREKERMRGTAAGRKFAEGVAGK